MFTQTSQLISLLILLPYLMGFVTMLDSSQEAEAITLLVWAEPVHLLL